MSDVLLGVWVNDNHAGKRAALSRYMDAMCQIKRKADEETDNLVLFLCGDVMTGRGIDQILLYPSKPKLHESYMTNAMGNVALAEDVSGIIPRRVAPAYIWGDALTEFERIQPDLKIINLETAITKLMITCLTKRYITACTHIIYSVLQPQVLIAVCWRATMYWIGVLPGLRKHWLFCTNKTLRLLAPVGMTKKRARPSYSMLPAKDTLNSPSAILQRIMSDIESRLQIIFS